MMNCQAVRSRGLCLCLRPSAIFCESFLFAVSGNEQLSSTLADLSAKADSLALSAEAMQALASRIPPMWAKRKIVLLGLMNEVLTSMGVHQGGSASMIRAKFSGQSKQWLSDVARLEFTCGLLDALARLASSNPQFHVMKAFIDASKGIEDLIASW